MTDDARAETLLFQLLEGEITAESLDAADRAAIAALDGRHAAETLRGAALLSQLLGPSPWRERDADPDALAGELAAKRAGLAEAERVPEIRSAVAKHNLGRYAPILIESVPSPQTITRALHDN